MNEKSKKKPKVWLILMAVLLVLAIVADCVSAHYWEVIAAAFSDTEAITNDNLMDEAVAESRAINAEISAEGSVLLKNNGALPINASVSKLNVYGVISANVYMNTAGSGSVNNEDSVSLKAALEGEGYEVNGALWDLLSKQEVDTSSSTIKEGTIKDETVSEISLAQYESAASWTSAKSYSDYAIVTFGRAGAEGSDLSRGSDSSYSYLELGASEIALLEKLKAEGFTVITLINSSHVMELGPVIENSDAVLWIGGPGLTGLEGVARILSGKVSPSGRLVDTWMYEQETSSTYYTAQQYNYYLGKTSVGGYTNYNEGIYVGYKWYETADAEGYWDEVDNDYGTGYAGVVAYPFGYGLSYADLSEKIESVDHADGTLTFTVTATNSSDVPAKDVFELYVEKPYTQGGVEVPKVELVGFAKSEEIANGSYTTTITVKEEDLASYDSAANAGKGAYVLAGGEYKFYLASGELGAHCWTTEENSRVYSVNLDKVEYSGSNARSTDQVAAENKLGLDGNVMTIDDTNAGFVALSRANGFANAQQAIGKPAQGYVSVSETDAIYKQMTGSFSAGTYSGEILANLKTEQSKKYSIADLYTTDAEGNPLYDYDFDTDTKTVTGKVDFNDPRWDDLIAQMSVDEMQMLIGRGGWQTAKVESIDKEKGVDYDGPSGLSNLMQNMMGVQTKCTSFQSEPVSASTWNVELIERLGKAVGKEANASGQAGWYAPGANIHRSPFGGRNAEYFSEDAYLSGEMCAAESKGALSVGLYCVGKHFAFNDIEANRTSMENCYMTEQTAREIYLKAYEKGVKSGDLPGLMMSYMWINGDWCGASSSLLTGIVRNEWGFDGMITTDNAGVGGGVKWMEPARILNAGGDMVLNATLMKLPDSFKNSDEGLSAMKTASKHILYTYASASLNRLEAMRVGENRFVPLFIGLNVLLYGAAIACGVVYVIKRKRAKKAN